MAVEAHHLLHTGGPQKLATHTGWEGSGICCEAAQASAACYYGRDAAAAGRQSQLQGHQYQKPSCVGLAAAPAPAPLMMGQQYGQVCAATDASESGVTFCGAQEAAAAPRKRKRAEQPQFVGLGAAGVAAHLQQQLVDVDRLVLQHTAKMWAELTEQRRRHTGQVAAAVEAAVVKRLRAKDEEIERIGRLNWALEERVKSLFVEAQVWRDLAQSNEASANALRGELQQALDAQVRRGIAAANGADDAASCCCGENDVGAGAGEEVVGTASAARGTIRACTVCGEGAAEVLLLPCRHLCPCAPCAAAARACPACGGAKNGSVCVNFS